MVEFCSMGREVPGILCNLQSSIHYSSQKHQVPEEVPKAERCEAVSRAVWRIETMRLGFDAKVSCTTRHCLLIRNRGICDECVARG
jgi:hypothetical protein